MAKASAGGSLNNVAYEKASFDNEEEEEQNAINQQNATITFILF